MGPEMLYILGLFSSLSFAGLPPVNPFCIAAVDSFNLEQRAEIGPAFTQETLLKLFIAVNDATLDLPDVPRRLSYASWKDEKSQIAAAALNEIILDFASLRPTRHVLYFNGKDSIAEFYGRYKELARFITSVQRSFKPVLWERIYRAFLGKLGALWSAKKSMVFGGTTVSAGLLSRYLIGFDETTELGAVLVGLIQSGIGALSAYGPAKGANAWSVISNAVLTEHDRPVFPDYSPSEVFASLKPGQWEFRRILFTEPNSAFAERQSPTAAQDAPAGVTAQDIRRYALSGRPEFMAITSPVAEKTVIESIVYLDQDSKEHFFLFIRPL